MAPGIFFPQKINTYKKGFKGWVPKYKFNETHLTNDERYVVKRDNYYLHSFNESFLTALTIAVITVAMLAVNQSPEN